jgi:hypothetical protein
MRLNAPLNTVRQYKLGVDVIVVGAKQASGREDALRETMLNKPLRRQSDGEDVRLELVMPTGMEQECIACWLTLEQCDLQDENGELFFEPGMTYEKFKTRYYDPRLTWEFGDLDGNTETFDLRDYLVATVAEVNPDWFPEFERVRLGGVREGSEKVGKRGREG